MKPKKKPASQNQWLSKLPNFSRNYKKLFSYRFYLSLLFDTKYLILMALALLIAEVFVNIFIIKWIKYTEIDWIAYMQEVEGVINGTMDYSQLRGDTGPLVYPAGFVYIFTLFYHLTDHGKDINFAQHIFAGLYILTLILVFQLYVKSKKVPPYVLIITCCTSYRIHSIYVLRMFNDPVAMILLYLSLNLFLNNRWSLGSSIYSMAVSIKMNILLFSPVLLLAYWTCLGFIGTLKQLAICAGIQLFLGAPFLLTNPIAYLKGSFDLGRVFLYEWTVNWRFLPEEIFVSKYFHISLLAVHLILLAIFYSSWKVYFTSYARLKYMETRIQPELKKHKKSLDMSTASNLFLTPMFTANFIGVACSRSLHYQFYVWYYHSLPYLLWSTKFPDKYRIMLLGVIELCWNTFPSTMLSSAALHVCHIAILYGLYQNRHVKQNAA
ncbi:unnamed protein product [Bemisia tabaci]|uniref:dolichyl-P-Man:Man5GlcNAc2-PP-dolichol alpha-1,3-mannosyltransferase n=1 Tax=Bemisia tabaci TaxID=7038 RepID=A0A9P0F0I0_BEMTA|nr:unnamed protein product [Bemisia tabaci]